MPARQLLVAAAASAAAAAPSHSHTPLPRVSLLDLPPAYLALAAVSVPSVLYLVRAWSDHDARAWPAANGAERDRDAVARHVQRKRARRISQTAKARVEVTPSDDEMDEEVVPTPSRGNGARMAVPAVAVPVPVPVPRRAVAEERPTLRRADAGVSVEPARVSKHVRAAFSRRDSGFMALVETKC
ncbi:hypothetical protein AMAG_13742 [Allomyces macrogynus ATCC 38327]|uniref:Uncharacterized protein n=1 Tax=Allomyces macrogynus (strain ATCC 38327) TaxID=578462 RepID=A0A0L0T3S8_ALLM3|nr:hypothetical protein AMAG_13742 [Allomyces macrogynus ATCC 38327]|eukprot:KNE69376.1 hypothetical protein AMAG_13742 [Allomyces macrogynus ATCC 38327]